MNKEFENKRNAALKILEQKKISRANYMPPTYIFLWKIGVNIRPPHFIKFNNLLLISGFPFGFIWLGIAMMDHRWFIDNICFVGLIFFVVIVSIGGLIAIYYRISSIKNRVPKWEDLSI